MSVQLFGKRLYFESELVGALRHRHIHVCGCQRSWFRRVLSSPDCARSVCREKAAASLTPLSCGCDVCLPWSFFILSSCLVLAPFFLRSKSTSHLDFFLLLISPSTLQYLEPPSFEQTPDSVEVLPGMSLTFTSVIRGTPPFKVKWFKGSRELVPGESCNISLEDFVTELELFEVQPLQSGDYSCLVTNDAGSASCTTHLFVKGLLFPPICASFKISPKSSLEDMNFTLMFSPYRTSHFCEKTG